MARSSPWELADALLRGVLAPLVIGEVVRPLDPLGVAGATLVAEAGPKIPHSERAAWMDVIRVRHARRICRVDTLEPPVATEWYLAAVLNDLLVCARLSPRALRPSRRPKLVLRAAAHALDLVTPPRTVREAVARHATFARVAEVQRVDRSVRWWCGQADFLGRRPPQRLLAWPSLRRISVEESTVTLPRMVTGDTVFEHQYREVLNKFLQATPLTDLSTAWRKEPAFCWARSSMALLTSPLGRALCVRALRQEGKREAVDAARTSLSELEDTIPEGTREVIQGVLREVESYLGVEGDAM